MTTPATPELRPANTHFSSGPCSKRPGWSLDALSDAALGRSHRAKVGKSKLKQAIDLTREILQVPADYRIGIVPASDTGAVEMALWSLLGPRGVDMVAWESFGSGWVSDVVKELKLPDTRKFVADYGKLVDFSQVDFDRDVVFTWNGTNIRRAGCQCRFHSGLTARALTILRCDVCRICTGHRFRQARCRHLLLAEGSGRRGRAWHPHPVAACRRTAGKL